MVDKKNKYHDIDDLLDGNQGELPVSARTSRRRPSPALGAMTGDKKPTSTIEAHKKKAQAAEEALVTAKVAFEAEKQALLNKIENTAPSEGSPIVLTMPVTKQEVNFELKRVNPSLIDVSPENERIQEFLDEISLQDILPSIRKHGQQKPGTLRPTANGRFELIEGSRRKAAVTIAQQDYLALVGDVPDADVRELSVIENKHQDVSPYEKAKAYQKQIASGEFENWTQLGAAKGISSSHISRYKACVELDEKFVRILPSPSDMPLSFGETISGLIKKDEPALSQKVIELLEVRKSGFQGGEMLDSEEIIKLLKSSVRTKSDRPTAKKPMPYKSIDGAINMKHSVSSKGSTKFEMMGVSDEKLDKILEFLVQTLKVEKQ